MLLDPTVKRHYDIIAAMRGPDIELRRQSGDGVFKLDQNVALDIKKLTTAVIRYFVGMSTDYSEQAYLRATVFKPGDADNHWDYLDADDRKAVIEAFNSDLFDHYAKHVWRAMDALADIEVVSAADGKPEAVGAGAHRDFLKAIFGGEK